MINRFIYLFFILALIISSSCNSANKKNNLSSEAIVKVYDTYLTLSDLENAVPKNISIEDSIKIAETYITSWVNSQVVLHEAEKQVDIKDHEIEKLIENYKKSLIVFEYEQKIIEEKLDTVVRKIEIENYYEQNKNNFKLKNNIVQVLYVITEKNFRSVSQLKNLMSSEDTLDYQKIKMLEDANIIVDYYIDVNNWMSFNDLQKIIPIKTYNEESFIKNNKSFDFADDNYRYFVTIKDYRVGESTSPIELVEENIKSIIINKRKRQIIKQLEQDLHNQALKKNKIEYY